MVRILLSGALGKMGRTVAACVEEDENCSIVAGLDRFEDIAGSFPVYSSADKITEAADVIIDFSHPSALPAVLDYAVSKKIPAVIATTGLSQFDMDKVSEASKIVPIFRSANMSLGINLLLNLVSKAAAVLQNGFDIEVIEKHHNQKLDAPSGTALMITDAISKSLDYAPHYMYDRHSRRAKREKTEIGIHSIRAGNITGEHEVLFASAEEMIEIKHTAVSKGVFASGAINAAKFLVGKQSGIYSMTDLVNEMK
ncbi:MAG: 4-hydroxy-tetrahydrodipicolinate reductase [Bacillota bacterium]|nr:4-hydroxy-tetrahydrodipicolinate reductase [Bacillota bacterium]